MFRKALILVLLLLAAANVSATVFKWVDDKGVTHYSETAPSKQKATEVQAQPTPPVEGAAGVNPETERWQKLEAEYQKRKAERQAGEKVKELEEENAQRLAVENKKKCIQAQQSLFALQQRRPVFTLNEKGERVYLNDTARPAEIEKTKRDIETYCKQS